MTDRPIRVQRKRIKGWKMPENTVYVGRPTKWGNPWIAGDKVSPHIAVQFGDETPSWFGRKAGDLICDAADAVEMYRKWIPDCAERNMPWSFGELRGKNLACWCRLADQHGNAVPCHADVLLSIANNIPMEEVVSENLRRSKRETSR